MVVPNYGRILDDTSITKLFVCGFPVILDVLVQRRSVIICTVEDVAAAQFANDLSQRLWQYNELTGL